MNILILALLLFKHFICDFLTQTQYQIAHKATYAHPGGLIHAGLHGVGTFCVFIFFYSIEIALICAALDLFIHYHIDWFKAKLTHRFKLKMEGATSRKFWSLFGLDQFLHQMSYFALLTLGNFLLLFI